MITTEQYNSIISELLDELPEEFFRELTGGYTDAEIGEHLHMSRFTVRDYVKAMREKTGFRSRTELAVKARQSGLVILEPNPEGSSKKPE